MNSRVFFVFFVFFVYRILLFFLRPILNLLGPFFPSSKWSQLIRDRKSKTFVTTNPLNFSLPLQEDQKPFWIHAASGEIEYARPVLRELKKDFPHTPIVVTYSSVSAKKILTTVPEIDFWGPLPWDTPGEVKKFLRQWQPQVLLIARTDVWPEMSFQTRQQRIPSLLFSATLSSQSRRLRGLGFSINAFALKQLSHVMVVGDEDLFQFKKFQLSSLEIGGDTRYDQVFHRLQHPKPVKESLRPAIREKSPGATPSLAPTSLAPTSLAPTSLAPTSLAPTSLAPTSAAPPSSSSHGAKQTIVCGSTWPEDEEVLFSLMTSHPELHWILVPHEVNEDHLQKIENRARELRIGVQYYSKSKEWTKGNLLVVDEVGTLAELYTWGDFAFVGGSFRRQVHSVMEPLASGNITFIGPHHLNNREAVELQKVKVNGLPLVTALPSKESAPRIFSELLLSNPGGENHRRAVIERLQSFRGASAKVSTWVHRMKS